MAKNTQNIKRVTTTLFENSTINNLRIALESNFTKIDDGADLTRYYGKSGSLFAQSQLYLTIEYLSGSGNFQENRKTMLSTYSMIEFKALLEEIKNTITHPDFLVYGTNGDIQGINTAHRNTFLLANIGMKKRALNFVVVIDSQTPGAAVEPLVLIEHVPNTQNEIVLTSNLRLDDFMLIYSLVYNLDIVNTQLAHINIRLAGENIYTADDGGYNGNGGYNGGYNNNNNYQGNSYNRGGNNGGYNRNNNQQLPAYGQQQGGYNRNNNQQAAPQQQYAPQQQLPSAFLNKQQGAQQSAPPVPQYQRQAPAPTPQQRPVATPPPAPINKPVQQPATEQNKSLSMFKNINIPKNDIADQLANADFDNDSTEPF